MLVVFIIVAVPAYIVVYFVWCRCTDDRHCFVHSE